jgi:hypothetical protein
MKFLENHGSGWGHFYLCWENFEVPEANIEVSGCFYHRWDNFEVDEESIKVHGVFLSLLGQFRSAWGKY